MLFGIVMVIAAIVFYAFIGTAKEDVIKVGLTLFWVALLVFGILAEFLY